MPTDTFLSPYGQKCTRQATSKVKRAFVTGVSPGEDAMQATVVGSSSAEELVALPDLNEAETENERSDHGIALHAAHEHTS